MKTKPDLQSAGLLKGSSGEPQPRHTPTPWVLGCSENEWGERSIWANKVNGEPKTMVVGPLNQANAAFIVRAVNAHDELVKVLTHIVASAPLTGLPLGLEKDIQDATIVLKNLRKI